MKNKRLILGFTLRSIFPISAVWKDVWKDRIFPVWHQALPYDLEFKMKNLSLTFTRTRLFVKSQIHEQYYNQQQGCRDLRQIAELQKIVHSNEPSNLTVNSKNNIPNNTCLINNIIDSNVASLPKIGVTIANPNQAADKLINNPDNAFFHGLDSVSINQIITSDEINVN